MDQAEQAPVPKWRPDADVALLPRGYPKIAQIVREAGPEGIRAVEVHRRLGWPDTDGSAAERAQPAATSGAEGLAAAGKPRGVCLGGGRVAFRPATGLRPVGAVPARATRRITMRTIAHFTIASWTAGRYS